MPLTEFFECLLDRRQHGDYSLTGGGLRQRFYTSDSTLRDFDLLAVEVDIGPAKRDHFIWSRARPGKAREQRTEMWIDVCKCEIEFVQWKRIDVRLLLLQLLDAVRWILVDDLVGDANTQKRTQHGHDAIDSRGGHFVDE